MWRIQNIWKMAVILILTAFDRRGWRIAMSRGHSTVVVQLLVSGQYTVSHFRHLA